MTKHQNIHIYVLFVLTAVCLLAHWLLVDVGLALTNSDYAYIALESNDILAHGFKPFFDGQNYGGTLLSCLRALWLSVAGISFRSHMIFSYVISPLLMTWAAYFLVSAFASRRTAFLVGLIAAIGFESWTLQYGNDFYIGYLVLGMLVLGLRGQTDNPFTTFSLKRLALMGVIAGLAAWQNRASLLFSALAFLPIPKNWKSVWQFFRPIGDLFHRCALYIAFALVCLFLYLETFGSSIGPILGHKVILHGEPNLKFAILVLLIDWCRLWWKSYSGIFPRKTWLRLSVVGASFLIGFAPEWIHWLRLGAKIPNLTRTQGIPEMFTLLGKVPGSIQELFAGGQGFGRHFSALLAILGLAALLRSLKDSRKYLIPALLVLLAVFSYCRFRTYASGPARYLFPIFPALLLGIAAYLERAWTRTWTAIVAVSLVATHLGYQGMLRYDRVKEIRASGAASGIITVVESFQSHHVDWIISDDYWQTHQFNLAANGNTPRFLNTNGLVPAIIGRAWHASPHPAKGEIFGSFVPADRASKTSVVDFEGKKLSLTNYTDVASYRLFFMK
jgi:hypothetical protein